MHVEKNIAMKCGDFGIKTYVTTILKELKHILKGESNVFRDLYNEFVSQWTGV